GGPAAPPPRPPPAPPPPPPLPGGLAVSGTERAPRGLPWRPAKPAPRNTRSAPLTTNAPHLKVDDVL
ncbi:hypothetical protein Q6A26_21650, partial [Xanthomonas euvesicatoria pv. eucalypti]|nr:hypothetical protein [Xanthomonas euvesicatoria pv. eucalypti]